MSTDPQNRPGKPGQPLLALWFNGALHSGDAIGSSCIAPTDRGLLLGDGLFETLPIFNGHPLWFDDHLHRMAKSAENLGLPFERDNWIKAVGQLVPFAPDGNGILRLTLTRGSGGRGLIPPALPTPTMMATLAPYPAAMRFADVTLVTSSIRRNEMSPTAQMKTLGYLDAILATRDANARGAEDALFLNSQDKITSTTIANLFAIMDGEIVTPPIPDGLLPGIMRQKLLDILPGHGLRAHEQSLTLENAKKADGLFLTNSLRFIRRVTRLDETGYDASQGNLIATCQKIVMDEITRLTGAAL